MVDTTGHAQINQGWARHSCQTCHECRVSSVCDDVSIQQNVQQVWIGLRNRSMK